AGRIPGQPGAAGRDPAGTTAHPHRRAGRHLPRRPARRPAGRHMHRFPVAHFLRDDALDPDAHAEVLDLAAAFKRDRYAHQALARYTEAIVMRTFGDERLAEVAAGSRVPVVNALTDGFHPCQALADLLTVRERCGGTAGRTLAYLGDTANNMSHSYLLAGAT